MCEENNILKKIKKSSKIKYGLLIAYTKSNVKDYLARPKEKFDS